MLNMVYMIDHSQKRFLIVTDAAEKKIQCLSRAGPHCLV
jgi:hypothetical protein